MERLFCGLILAGGAGTRYGGAKAHATLPDGQSFLARCAATLGDAGAGPLFATLPPGMEDPNLPGLRVVPLAAHGMDMLASLRVGLGEALRFGRWDAVVVLPVDHVLVAPPSIRQLAAVACPVAVPVYLGSRGHPVCLSRPTAQSVASGALQGRTLREALDTVGRTEVAVDDPGVVANCNTPELLIAGLASITGRR
jgi:CTP:molybdopterin cytidylyltransferase MocA